MKSSTPSLPHRDSEARQGHIRACLKKPLWVRGVGWGKEKARMHIVASGRVYFKNYQGQNNHHDKEVNSSRGQQILNIYV